MTAKYLLRHREEVNLIVGIKFVSNLLRKLQMLSLVLSYRYMSCSINEFQLDLLIEQNVRRHQNGISKKTY
jgi:hypothetical protein